MKLVFVDTVYWIARVRPGDQWKTAAEHARDGLPPSTQLVTTDEVLTEFLAGLSRGGATLRTQACNMVHAILNSSDVRVLEQSRQSFLSGISLYNARPDKQYSLVDCISMSQMRPLGITDVLTNDRHFQQEGFNILMLM
jgi:predicted nucleic acid-binding protein